MKSATRDVNRLLWPLLFLLAGVIAGCGGGGGGATPTGTLGVSLTDTPACGFSAVNVTVNKVRVHQSATASDTSAGWTDITLNPSKKVNLLDLTNGVLSHLGDTQLAAGHYTQLRLVLDSNTGSTTANSVVLEGTSTEIPLNTPSAVQSGIKLINEFDVIGDQRVDLVLDFDACKSVVSRGSGAYSLMPVVQVIPFTLNGIEGYVSTALLPSKVLVSAQTSTGIVASTVPDAQGHFLIARMPAGSYNVVVTADAHATGVIAAVPVTTSAITAVSTIGVPINLPTSATATVSGTETLNPASSTVAAFATAKQTIGANSLTVKSQAADLASGAYSLTLPVGAPLLGQYGTVLPITLTAQSAAAGKYTIEASASGYATQTAGVDISAGNVSRSFTLVP
jgi:hypothetical protein